MQVIDYALLEIGFVASLLFFLALHPLYVNTISKAFVALGNVGISGVTVFGRHVGRTHPFHFFITLDEAIKTKINNGKAWSERGVVYSFNQLIGAIAVIAAVPVVVALALKELADWAISAVGKTATTVVVQKIYPKAKTAVQTAAQVTGVQFRHLTARVARLEARVDRIAHAGAATIADPFPRVRAIDREIADLKAKYGKLLKLLTFAGAFALVVRAIGVEMANLLRCGKVKKVAKEVCHFDSRWLDALIAGFALIYVSEGIIPFAKTVQGLVGDLAPATLRFWKATAIGKGGDRKLGDAGLTPL